MSAPPITARTPHAVLRWNAEQLSRWGLRVVMWGGVLFVACSGFVLAIVVASMLGPDTGRRSRTTETQLKSFKGPLQLYLQEEGRLPIRLSELVDGGYMPELPTDAWGNDFLLFHRSPTVLELRSLGEDERLATGDDIRVTLDFHGRD